MNRLLNFLEGGIAVTETLSQTESVLWGCFEAPIARKKQRLLLRLHGWLIFGRLALSAQANQEVDDLDEKHDGESKPEAEDAADVRPQDLHRHRRLVLDHQRKVALQHHVQLQEVFGDERQQRRILQRHRVARVCIASGVARRVRAALASGGKWAKIVFKKRRVSPAGNRQPIPGDPLPAVSYKWFAGT